ncbi:hypothetical protein [Maridesulfovibrio ferrireducens]|uniref:hypothetical protein n=1 Tax=Maridesulfovibrio ferrireducens TaxID=246191 RepID=UPI001A24AEA7|nr:hypothetical protein [Maridesulfovibrio ferrireducens]MBI9109998.1 hypothetical protein [Maridesulfovibrio ferrireducens]
MIPIPLILSFLGGGKGKLIAVIAVACLVLGTVIYVSVLRGEISDLKVTVAELESDKTKLESKLANEKTKTNLATADKDRLNSVVSGLQVQVEQGRENHRKYIRRLSRAQEIARKAVSVKPSETTGVVDAQTSNSTIGLLNDIFMQPSNSSFAR